MAITHSYNSNVPFYTYTNNSGLFWSGTSATGGTNVWVTSGATTTTAANTNTASITYNQLVAAQNQWNAITPAPAPRPDPRIINKYLNASDLIGEFIKDLGGLGLKQGSVLGIPIELFINWLIVRSAEEDGKADEVKDVPKLPSRLLTYRRDRCRACGRFITRAKVKAELFFCSGAHFERSMA